MIWAVFQIVGLLAPEVKEQLASAFVSGRNHAAADVRVGVILLIIVTVTTLIYMIYSLAESRTAGILLIFLLSVLMVYLSGGFVPSILMPQAMQTVGEVLPTSYLIRAFGGLLTGYNRGALGQCVTGMCFYTAAFGAVGYFFGCRK